MFELTATAIRWPSLASKRSRTSCPGYVVVSVLLTPDADGVIVSTTSDESATSTVALPVSASAGSTTTRYVPSSGRTPSMKPVLLEVQSAYVTAVPLASSSHERNAASLIVGKLTFTRSPALPEKRRTAFQPGSSNVRLLLTGVVETVTSSGVSAGTS